MLAYCQGSEDSDQIFRGDILMPLMNTLVWKINTFAFFRVLCLMGIWKFDFLIFVIEIILILFVLGEKVSYVFYLS